MRKPFLALLSGALIVVLSVGVGASTAASSAAAAGDPATRAKDNLESPLGKKQAALKEKGLAMKLQGKVAQDAKVVKVAKGQYVQLAREGEDKIWTVLGDFGPNDSPFTSLKSGIPGPVHNQIPEPDRSRRQLDDLGT